MGYPTKIATCCYCGSRAALVLGKDRHELNCASCGAPLHDMKRLRRDPDPVSDKKQVAEKRRSKVKKPSYGVQERRKPKQVKKRKSFMQHLIEEAFDVIEDMID